MTTMDNPNIFADDPRNWKHRVKVLTILSPDRVYECKVDNIELHSETSMTNKEAPLYLYAKVSEVKSMTRMFAHDTTKDKIESFRRDQVREQCTRKISLGKRDSRW